MKITLSILVLVLAQAVDAQQCTTLIYTGAATLAVVEDQGPYPLWFTTVIGTVTLSSPLPANASNLTVTPAAWDFSTEQAGLSSSNAQTAAPYASAPTFAFSTDANGNITGWGLEVHYNNLNNDTSMLQLIADVTSYTEDNQDYVVKAAIGPGTGGRSSLNAGSSGLGTWSCLSPVVDPLTAEVASLQAQLAAVKAANASLLTEYRPLAQHLAAAYVEIAALTAEVEKLK